MAILPDFVCKFNINTIKMLADFVVKMDILILIRLEIQTGKK